MNSSKLSLILALILPVACFAGGVVNPAGVTSVNGNAGAVTGAQAVAGAAIALSSASASGDVSSGGAVNASVFSVTGASGLIFNYGGAITLNNSGNHLMVLPTGIQVDNLTASGAITSATFPVARLVSVPSSATASGSPGDYAADTSYIYVCYAANAWRRTAATTF